MSPSAAHDDDTIDLDPATTTSGGGGAGPLPFYEIKPGATTSEHANCRVCQYTGGGFIAAVLTLYSTVPAFRELPPSVMITLIIVGAVITLIPTLHYIASRTRVKRSMIEASRTAEAEVLKAQAQANTATNNANRAAGG